MPLASTSRRTLDDDIPSDEERGTDPDSNDSDTSELSVDEESEEEGEEGEESEEDDFPTPEEANAEKEIEGDFDRLIQTIRQNEGSSSSGMLSRDWDINIAEREAEFRDDLRAASGIGKRRRKKGRSAGPVLSQQVQAMIGEGNQAFVDDNTQEAIRIMQEVIRIEPRATAAWSVLANCYDDMNQRDKGLQIRIMAAHLRHDADEWDALAQQSREMGYNQQALYCYRKVYSLDPTNIQALWERAVLAKSIGDFKTARNAFWAILKRVPHELSVLRELHPILIELSELPSCAELFQQSFDHYQRLYPAGFVLDSNNKPIEGGGFGGLDLLLLADLYNTLGEHEKAIEVIRKGTRWLQGRAEQKYWDLCEDDREFDLPEWAPRSNNGGEDATEVVSGRFPLEINARHRLAVARIKLSEFEEGKLHASVILSQDVKSFSVLFAEIADAYFEKQLWAEAKPIYELLGCDPETSSLYILLQTAACRRMMEELKEAAEVYEHIKSIDPANNDAKMKLAEIYEAMGEPRKALELVYEVIDSRKRRGKGDVGNQTEDQSNVASTSLFEERSQPKSRPQPRTPRLTHAQLRELESQKEKEALEGYHRVQELWPGMLAGGPEAEKKWLAEAEKLVEMFRETRNLFLTSRTHPFRGMFPRRRKKQQLEAEADEDRMASRLQLDLEREDLAKWATKRGEKQGAVDVFRGVSFDDWLRIFMQYSFLLTKQGQSDLANEVLGHILLSNAYQTRARQDVIRLALITVAIAIRDYRAAVDHSRKLITAHQFNNEPLRILLASLSSGLVPTDAFITSTLQKHLFREMKLSDTAVKHPEMLKWNPLNKRYAPTGSKATEQEQEEEEDNDEVTQDATIGSSTAAPTSAPDTKSGLPPIPTAFNPVIITIYGQICIAAKSYQSAIFYLLHAYDYCPEDPMVCLCLAIASIGRAMQRQSDNRHHLIAQALAFLTQYRKLRGTNPRGLGEVEFNFGRTFHQLGLYSHAVKQYQKVIDMAETGQDSTFVREAAYNLSLIYVLTGATPLADALYRRWLSI